MSNRNAVKITSSSVNLMPQSIFSRQVFDMIGTLSYAAMFLGIFTSMADLIRRPMRSIEASLSAKQLSSNTPIANALDVTTRLT